LQETFRATGKIFLSQTLTHIRQNNDSIYPYLSPVDALWRTGVVWVSSRRTAVVTAECTPITTWCRRHQVRSNSHTQAVYPSSLMLLHTYIDQMQTVKQEDNTQKEASYLCE